MPDFPVDGFTREVIESREDTRVVAEWRGGFFDTDFTPSDDPTTYAVARSQVRRNLYRVPLR